ncbi:MAG TPA: hypothetical protein PLQ93_06465 [Bacteroidia bacterium]|nr:hypothetical protein [Bacteroidia bacterium]
MKSSLVFACLFTLSFSSHFAQKSQVQAAWRALSDYEESLKENATSPEIKYLDKARDAINTALANEDSKNMPKAHAYKLRISYNYYRYNLGEELKRLEASVQDKNERYSLAYGKTSLTEFEEANNELAVLKDLDPKFIEKIQNAIITGNTGSLDEEEFKFAIAVQEMKVEAPNIATGKYKLKEYEVSADYFYKSAFMNSVLYKSLDTANFYNACIAAGKSGNPDKVIEYNKRMLDAKLDMPYNYISLSNAYQAKGDTSLALQQLKKGREVFPSDNELLARETDLFLATRKQEEALTNLKLASQKDPKNGLYYMMIGNIYDNLANPRDKNGKDLPKPANFNDLFNNAESNYLKSVELSGGDAELSYNSRYNIGALYNNHGAYLENKNIDKITDFAKYQKENAAKSQEYYKKAIPYLEQALNLKPQDINTMKALRLLYFKTGEEAKAKAMQQRIDAAK